MRRFFVFLLLFGAGLALVLILERGAEEPEVPLDLPAEVRPGERPAAGTPDDGSIEVPIPLTGDESGDQPGDGGQSSGVRVDLGGEGELIEKRGDWPVWRMTGDFDLQGEVLIANGARIVFYQPESTEVEVTLTAEVARVPIDLSSQPPGVDPDAPVELETVRVEAQDWSALSPVVIVVPRLTGTLGAERFTSADPVVIEGQGLVARGTGLELTPDSVAIERDVRVRLARPEGGVATLRCGERLTFERFLALGEEGVRITATGGARLVAEQPETRALVGQTIRLTGRAVRGEGDQESLFLPTSTEAERNVELDLGGSLFTGGRGRVRFDDSGQAQSAVLEQDPTVDLAVGPLDPSDLPFDLGAGVGDVRVTADGRGPLTIEFAERSTFEFGGPVELEIPLLDAAITARDRLRGRQSAGGRFEELEAVGAVHGVFESFALDTTALTVAAPGGSEAALQLRAQGPTRVLGELSSGEPFELRLTGLAVMERVGAGFVIRRAEGADLWLGPLDEARTHARADLVLDLDLEELSFTAEGDVTVDGPEGTGWADRVVARGRRMWRLYGGPEAPARFRRDEGELHALLVDVEPYRLTAGGEAHAELVLEGRTWILDARQIDLRRRTVTDAAGKLVERLRLEADGRALLDVRQDAARLALTADWIAADADVETVPGATPEDLPQEIGEVVPGLLVARGDVQIDIDREVQLEAHGEHLLLTGLGTGVLRGTPEERVTGSGDLPGEGLSFELEADRLEFGPQSIMAQEPDVRIDGVELPMGPLSGRGQRGAITVRSGTMAADPASLLFTDGVSIERVGADADRWRLDAGSAKLSMDLGDDLGEIDGFSAETVTEVIAWDGFTAEFGVQITTAGDSLIANRESGLVTVRGKPASVATPSFGGESDWIEWDSKTGLLRSDVGRLFSRSTGEGKNDFGTWSMTFSAMEPIPGSDVALQVVRQPIIRQGDSLIRAAWAVFWVDPDEWTHFSRRYAAGGGDSEPETFVIRDEQAEAERAALGRMPSLIAPLQSTQLARWLREGYIEGNIEYFVENHRMARADAMYLDLADGHGWIENVEIRQPLPFSGLDAELKVQIDWARHSADGSLRADDAIITTCLFEKPHFRIESGDLRLTPQPPKRGDEPYWELKFKDNAIFFGEGLVLPLPDSFGIPLNRSGGIHLDEAPAAVSEAGDAVEAVGGSTDRFGSFLRLGFVQDLSWIGKWLPNLIGADPEKTEGRTRYEVGYLGSRGLLLGINPRIEQAGLYFLDMNFDFVYDRGEDRGYLRVPEDERDELRRWIHLRSRYNFSETTWLDFVFSKQSDAAVQSEFWEGDWLRFAQNETFLHLRTAQGSNYGHVTLQARTDDFVTQNEKLPDAGWYRGRTQVADVGEVPLVYSSDTNVGYIRRLDGDPRYSDPYPDGLGDQDVLRASTVQRLETPITAGASGVRVVPYLEGRLAAWDEGDPTSPDDGSPSRVGLLGGLELSTLLWRSLWGFRHEVVPTIGYRTDLAYEESGAEPIFIDRNEIPYDGDFVELGLRQRVVAPDNETQLDLELRGIYADDTSAAVGDGWLPVRVYGDLYTSVAGIPLASTHDGRYDVQNGTTPYSRTRVGLEPWDPFQVELGYDSARDLTGVTQYNAWSIVGRYRPTPKWEFEAGNLISTLGDGGRLNSFFILRRFGHDLVFELEYFQREGEGGGIAFGLEPVLTWDESPLGLLDRRRRGAW